MNVEKGSLMKGKVSGITKFGAFVELENGLQGLVHISEIADTFVTDVAQFLKLGEEVLVKILGYNKNGKIELSLKQVKSSKPAVEKREHPVAASPVARESFRSEVREPRKEQADESFEAKISSFLKKSEEKLTDLKRTMREKQGYRKRGKR